MRCPLYLAALLPAASSYKVFIDGSAGTTGLQVRGRLENRKDITLISPPDELRKDEGARREWLNKADAAILCLPDDASKEAATWMKEDGSDTILIDASTAFRTDPDWVYGFPEMDKTQREKIRKSNKISNPGCYPTGFIGLIRPIRDLLSDTRLNVNAVSGYSGGGKSLMQFYESGDAEPFGAYGFALAHKHQPEMKMHAMLDNEPIFQPAVGNFPQGMLVNIPLRYDQLVGVGGKDLLERLNEWYAGEHFVNVIDDPTSLMERGAFLRPDTLKDTNHMELFMHWNDEKETALLTARLDNLGKGASGAAVQNLNIALGIDESTGL